MPSSTSNLFLGISTPLPEDTFEVLSVHGEEHLSKMFTYRVELSTDDIDVDFSKLIGQPVTIRINSEDGVDVYRNGIASRVSQAVGATSDIVYFLEVVPTIWLMSRTDDCRMFQSKSVPDIIQAIFKDIGLTDFAMELKGSFAPRDYCVQYGETDLDFITRLMEDEGIFYFFKHTDTKHTLVVANDADSHPTCLGGPLHYKQFDSSYIEGNAISGITFDHQIVPNQVRMSDYNFETPAINLHVEVDGTSNGHGVKLSGFEFPGGYMKKGDGERRAKNRIEKAEFANKQIRGKTGSRELVVGHTFDLIEHDRADLNTTYVLRSFVFDVDQNGFDATFTAFPMTVPFRPGTVTRKPRIPGYLLATVVGKGGEEIWTDEYGRVKVHFPWDRESKEDENSSCWVRVAQMWAGKAWGSLAIPRIGAEVVVAFLDGDPDRPLIVGTLYNAAQVVPYELPANKTRTTLKSNSSKGGGGFNEFRFEDLKGSEEIYVHAQKDYNLEVLNDRTTTIGGTQTITVEKADEETYNDTRTIAVAKADSETYSATRDTTVSKADSQTYGDNQTINVAKEQAITVGKKADQTYGDKLTVSVTKEYTFSAKKIQMTAEDEIVIKTGDAQITMKKNGDITIKGKAINVKASGDITMKGTQIKQN